MTEFVLAMRASFGINQTYFLSSIIVSLVPFPMTLDNRSGIEKNPVVGRCLRHHDAYFSDLLHLCHLCRPACVI